MLLAQPAGLVVVAGVDVEEAAEEDLDVKDGSMCLQQLATPEEPYKTSVVRCQSSHRLFHFLLYSSALKLNSLIASNDSATTSRR